MQTSSLCGPAWPPRESPILVLAAVQQDFRSGFTPPALLTPYDSQHLGYLPALSSPSPATALPPSEAWSEPCLNLPATRPRPGPTLAWWRATIGSFRSDLYLARLQEATLQSI